MKKLTGLACVVLSCAALHGEPDSADDLWRTAWSKDELLCDWLSQDAGIVPGKQFANTGAAVRVEARIAKAVEA